MEIIDLLMIALSLAAIIVPVKFVWMVFKGKKPGYVEYAATLIFLVYAFSDVYERLFWFVPSFWGQLQVGDEIWHADRYYYGVTLGGLMSLAVMVIFVKYVSLRTGEDPFDLAPPPPEAGEQGNDADNEE